MSIKNEQSIRTEIIKSQLENIQTRQVDFREFSERMMELKFNSEQAAIVWNVFCSQPNARDLIALEGFMKI